MRELDYSLAQVYGADEAFVTGAPRLRACIETQGLQPNPQPSTFNLQRVNHLTRPTQTTTPPNPPHQPTKPTGTMAGVLPVVEVDGRSIGSGARGPVVSRLQAVYSALMDREAAGGRAAGLEELSGAAAAGAEG